MLTLEYVTELEPEGPAKEQAHVAHFTPLQSVAHHA